MIADHAEILKRNLEVLVTLDCLSAKARLSPANGWTSYRLERPETDSPSQGQTPAFDFKQRASRFERYSD